MPSRLMRELLREEIEDMGRLSAERHRESLVGEEVTTQEQMSPEEAGAGGVSEGSPPRPRLRGGSDGRNG
jgi:hypothetical protein